MARSPETQKAVTVGNKALVLEILDAILDWALINSTPKTYQWRKGNLKAFAKFIPRTLTVAELKPFHITQEMNAHPTWGDDTRANFARCVQRAIRWAKVQGLIDRNPVEQVEKPGKGRRHDFYTREEYEHLLSLFPDQEFRDVLITAWETRCRPQELFAVEAKNVDLAGKRWAGTRRPGATACMTR
jgi:integrase